MTWTPNQNDALTTLTFRAFAFLLQHQNPEDDVSRHLCDLVGFVHRSLSLKEVFFFEVVKLALSYSTTGIAVGSTSRNMYILLKVIFKYSINRWKNR